MFNTLKEARTITGGLSEPSKMPGYSYNLPARNCRIGSALQKIAGSTCNSCYALGGRYLFRKVQEAMAFRLAAIKSPLWVQAMAFEINFRAKRSVDGADTYFRWHDSGDIQSVEHLEQIVEICNSTPGVAHWLPTRELGIVKTFLSLHGDFPSNLVVRISAPMIGEPIKGALGIPVATVGCEGFGQQCRANEHGGKCGSCRTCWTRANVNYPLH